MLEFPTPVHELPAGIGRRFVVLVVIFIAIIWGLLVVLLPNRSIGSGAGAFVFVGSISIILAILVNSAWDRLTDKKDQDD